ncbi:MAG: zinc-ribbon domain-containing protein [Deltaproteobacteria bacterium]|nr:zinc-ribbon domain-containing protein [Deltaproteobacteria bacterium]
MKIKCPECSTAYNIPDATLGGKPKKMKCAKCKHVFTLARRTDHPPEGYEEFAGGGGLPPEFAFLKASVPPKSPSAPGIPSLTDGGTFVGRPPSGAPTGPPTPVPVQDNTRTVIGRPAPVMPEPPSKRTETAEPPASPPPPAATGAAVQQDPFTQGIPEQALQQAQSPAAKAAVEELRRGGATPIRNSMPAEDMFGGAASAWEIEAPMELGSYAVTSHAPPPHGHQVAGKIIFGVIVLLIVFLLFVAFRNGWSLSLSGLPEQIAFAFSSEALEDIPDEAKNIEATVVSKKVVTSPRGGYLIVSGEVINNNPGSRSNVIVRGRLHDQKGDVRGEARMPCGHAVDEKVIRRTPPGSMNQHFMENGRPHNCQIGPNDNRIFQVVFDNLPADYDAGFDVHIMVVSATAP